MAFDLKEIVAARLGENYQLHEQHVNRTLVAAQRWDSCVVQGDTESAFLGALAAFYRQIPIAHVEAGLRTYNLARPFMRSEVLTLLRELDTAVDGWQRIRMEPAARFFLMALPLWEQIRR